MLDWSIKEQIVQIINRHFIGSKDRYRILDQLTEFLTSDSLNEQFHLTFDLGDSHYELGEGSDYDGPFDRSLYEFYIVDRKRQNRFPISDGKSVDPKQLIKQFIFEQHNSIQYGGSEHLIDQFIDQLVDDPIIRPIIDLRLELFAIDWEWLYEIVKGQHDEKYVVRVLEN